MCNFRYYYMNLMYECLFNSFLFLFYMFVFFEGQLSEVDILEEMFELFVV